MSLTPEQIEMRRSGIGASEVAAVCGLSPWAGPWDVYNRKVVGLEPDATDAMRAGNYLEDGIARWYADREGVDLAESTTLRHRLYPWALATPDRIVSARAHADDLVRGTVRSPLRLLEVKCVSLRSAADWGEEETDAVPVYYGAQVQWQLEIVRSLGWRTPDASLISRCDVACLVAGQTLRVYHVEYDAAVAQMLLAAVKQFWEGHVRPQVPPPLDGSDACTAGLRGLFPVRKPDDVVEADPRIDGMARRLLEVHAEQDRLDGERRLLEQHIQAAIADRGGIRGAGWRATWKAPARGGVAWKAVAEAAGARPEMIEAHRAEPVRRFVVEKEER